ncbi:hypothetical protein GGF45_000949 [Coemansia sp. RSA 551]|nr:hypothetical protein GGF45_000949 [Coemansia sp. RSA 551]KAJ2547656.1 hypothetical protein IWW35_004523 [Coemansia sp. RSA 1878]
MERLLLAQQQDISLTQDTSSTEHTQMTRSFQERLPFELRAAICAQLASCSCVGAQTQTFAEGCTSHHAPGAFGGGALSALRQTSRTWRCAALDAGLAHIVASNRWMRSGSQDRLHALHTSHAHRVRRLVFRSADFYPGGPRRSSDGALASELEAVLALEWPRLDAIVVDWFSGNASDHARIVAAVRRWAPRVRELSVRDKSVGLAEMAALVWGSQGPAQGLAQGPAQGPVQGLIDTPCALVRRLAVTPYGYNQTWGALRAHERGAAQMVAHMPSQLTALAIGGSDVTPELLSALQHTQPHLARLSIEHAWIDVLSTDVQLRAVTRLRLENVAFARGAALPLTPRMFPQLRSLTVRHTWQEAADGTRGATSLQDAQWLAPFLACTWPHLQALVLPAISDADAVQLAYACPALQRLTTISLDYAGPALSPAGLVAVLRLPRLRHLSIEQRRADGAPGYSFSDATLCRLIGAADDDVNFGNRVLRRSSCASSPEPSPRLSPSDLSGSDTEVEDSYFDAPQTISSSLNTLYIPRATLTASTLDALLKQLPNLVRLSVSLRGDSFVDFKRRPPWAHRALRWIAVSADEDILADPVWLSSWLIQRFPMLRECCTNHVRSQKQMVADLRAAAPAVAFTRLNSRALQTCS